jgi:general secretion pathway protein F
MAFYTIVVKRQDGKKETFDIESESERQAEFEGLRKGQVVSIKKKSDFKLWETGMSPAERNTFLYTLATLTGALSMNESLFIMQQNFTGNIKDVCAKLSRLLSTNEPQDAIEKIGMPNFPSSVVAMIKAGASAGDLSDALREAADFEQEMINIKKESGKGMYQAIGAFVIAAIVIFVVMFKVVPWMAESSMMKSMNVDITWLHPFGNSALYSMTFFFVMFLFLTLLGTVGRVVAAEAADNIIIRIPMYKDLVLSKLNFVTIYQLSRLIEKGIPLKVALQRTSENTGKGKLKSNIDKAIEYMNNGKEWSDAMETFNPMDRAGLRASTDATKISRTLKDLSTQYKNTYRRANERIGVTLYFIGLAYLGIAALLLFAYTTIPVLEGMGNGMS